MAQEPIAQPDLAPATIGSLVASWPRGFKELDGSAVPASKWQCSTTYPCITPITWALPSEECGQTLIDPTGNICLPGPCDVGSAPMSAVRLGVVNGCACTITPRAFKSWEVVSRETLESQWAHDLAAYLWDGRTRAGFVSYLDQLTFAEATHIDGGPYALADAIAVAVAKMREGGYKGALWLHMPDSLLPQLVTMGAVVVNGRWKLGNLTFVLDAGYPGTRPDDPAEDGIGSGTVWVVATGPGEWDATTVEVKPVNPLGHFCKTTGAWAERWAAARMTCRPMVAVAAKELSC